MLKEDWVAPHKYGLRMREVNSAEKETFELNATSTRAIVSEVTENTGIWCSEVASNCFGRLKIRNSIINWTRFILKRVYYTAARNSMNLFRWYRNSFLVLFPVIRKKVRFFQTDCIIDPRLLSSITAQETQCRAMLPQAATSIHWTRTKPVSCSNMQRLLFKQSRSSQKPFSKEFSAENHLPVGSDLKIQVCTKANMNQVNRYHSLNLHLFNHNWLLWHNESLAFP